MSEVIIRAENLSKVYRLGVRERYQTIRESLTNAVLGPVRRLRSREDGSATRESVDAGKLWALKDVSFEVRRGEVAGVIGRNGAGKSTLLKILSRITAPTGGSVDITGRVGSLLEVGTGFHPELSGRENIFLNGAILGMSRREVARKFDEIVAFSEVEKFIDTPVKRYSSGMYMRLAFAVAAHLEPDVLVIDEVLAVGDAAFQRKCLGKMGTVAAEGRTVLFVSHDMRAIRQLCTRAIYLRGGSVAAIGPVGETIERYVGEGVRTSPDMPVTSGDLTVHDFTVTQNGVPTDQIDGTDPFDVTVEFSVARDLSQFRLGVYLNGTAGEVIARCFLADWDGDREQVGAGRYVAKLRWPARRLFAGAYTLLLHASRYGVCDYLARHAPSHHLTVHNPVDFNPAHPAEAMEAVMIVDSPWQLASQASMANSNETP